MAPSPIAYSSISVTFSKHIMQPLASQPLATSSTAIDCLSRTIPMRLPAATDLTVTGTLCSMPYTMMVGRITNMREREGGREFRVICHAIMLFHLQVQVSSIFKINGIYIYGDGVKHDKAMVVTQHRCKKLGMAPSMYLLYS